MAGWCGTIFLNMKECQVLVIAEPTHNRFVYKILNRYTFLVLYEDGVLYGTISGAMEAGQEKAKEMGFHPEI